MERQLAKDRAPAGGEAGSTGARWAWDGVVETPLPGRLAKPRRVGITMVLDKGTPLAALEGYLAMGAPFVDLWKLGFGTSALLSQEALARRVALARRYGVEVYPGGTLLEVAVYQNQLEAWIDRALAAGLATAEVSDGTISLPLARREAVIARLREAGFTVITEVGKKHPQDRPPLEVLRETVQADLAAGAAWVIVEGRESGADVGIYRADGSIDDSLVEALVEAAGGSQWLLWEAPRKSQQQALLQRFGVNVNLGNVEPGEILALEALRLGLRSDTLRPVVQGG
ncbi:phosphosulfolactate synthase [Limnochorda sp.]|uniref:phosphosulfolactate synthase n=1 Tax=Limnochorda sp. TaxID=1940279 RepID=UPI00396F97F7